MPDGVKNGGGVLEHISRTIEIECLPTQIPGTSRPTSRRSGIGDSIHVRDLDDAERRILSDPDTTIATVVPPTGMTRRPRRPAGREGRARGDRQGQGPTRPGGKDEK
jgi:large subunit ribosomal protein L25